MPFRHGAGPRRQVDFPPRADRERARRRRIPHRRPARGRGRSRHRGGAARARRVDRAHGRRRVVGARHRHRRAGRARYGPGSGQFGNRGAAAAGRPRHPPAHRDDDRRRLASNPADGPGGGAAARDGRGRLGARRRLDAADGDRGQGPGADRVRAAGGVGAGQVGDPAGRAQHAGRDDGDRTAPDARSQRADAAPVRGRYRGRGAGRRARDRRARPAGDFGPRGLGAGRPVLGRLSRDRGAADTGLAGPCPRRRPQPDADRAVRLPRRDGRRRRRRTRRNGGGRSRSATSPSRIRGRPGSGRSRCPRTGRRG